MNRDYATRTENRLILHPQGKKKCAGCKLIFEKTSENFNIHNKKKDGTRTSDHLCKNCRSLARAKLKIRQKNDVEWYCNRLVVQIKHRAKELEIPFDLTGQDLYNVWVTQNGLCYYTNEEMNILAALSDKKSPHPDFPSVDRMIPADGYKKDNVVWCKQIVNRMKSNLSKREFVNFCKKVIEYHGE